MTRLILPVFFAAMLAASAAVGGQPAPAKSGTPARTLIEPEEAEPPQGPPRRTIFFQSQTIIVTVRPPPATEAEARNMMARGNQKCVRADRIAEATMLDDRAVQLKLRNGGALRLTLAENCPVLGFYGGFYVSRQADRLCAGRDFLLARSGQRCAISEIQRTKLVQ